MYWLPRSVGSKEGKLKHAGYFLYDPVCQSRVVHHAYDGADGGPHRPALVRTKTETKEGNRQSNSVGLSRDHNKPHGEARTFRLTAFLASLCKVWR